MTSETRREVNTPLYCALEVNLSGTDGSDSPSSVSKNLHDKIRLYKVSQTSLTFVNFVALVLNSSEFVKLDLKVGSVRWKEREQIADSRSVYMYNFRFQVAGEF